MKYRNICLFILLSFKLLANQVSTIDSLENILKSQNDTNLVITLNELTWQYRNISQEKALNYGFKALKLSMNLSFLKGIAQSYNDLGIIYFDQKNYSKALEFYQNSLKIREQLSDLNGQAALLMKIGIIHEKNGDFLKAVEFSQKSLSIYEQIGNEYGAAACLNNIAVINIDIGNFDEALNHLLKAVEIRKKINDLYNLSGTYVNIAGIYLKKKGNNEAIKYYLESLELCRKIGDKSYIATNLNNLSAVYFNIFDYENAIKTVTESYNLRKELKEYSELISCLKNMSDIYLKTNNHKLAFEKLNEALNISKTIKARTEMSALYSSFTSYYEYIGDYEKALENQKLQILYKDSLLNESMYSKITEMQTKYETEKKEQQLQLKLLEIERQKNQNKIQKLIFAGVATIILIIGFFIFYRIKQKQKAENIREQNRQEKLRFKAIIDSEEKERSRIAKELHDGLGQLLSSAKLNISSLEGCVPKNDEYLLQNSSNIIDEAVKEVRTISHNMMPTALMNYGIVEAISELVRRINDSNKVRINFDKSTFNSKLEKETEITLYRVIQEIINNMLKHSNADNIDIKFSENKSKIILSIIDNGIGFDTSKINESKGIGWKNIQSRVLMINGKIDINSQVGLGTKINITI